MSWYAEFGDQVRPDVPLAPLTWFGLGGPAKFFVQPRDLPSLQAIVARLRENEIPMHVLGSGANLLVNDQYEPHLKPIMASLRQATTRPTTEPAR